ncbi:unnamed protein product [Mesocestoides corti]|uniref:Uncharacterized protein n=1 Tax=Mesocestoides corti TaxID=53468 RepID=A0A3P6GTA6_MESCO|nr:unnamed protein product [Mesocestoides corti]
MKSVIERLKLRSPSRSRVQALEAPPPGQQPLTNRPNPKAGLIGVSLARAMATCKSEVVAVKPAPPHMPLPPLNPIPHIRVLRTCSPLLATTLGSTDGRRASTSRFHATTDEASIRKRSATTPSCHSSRAIPNLPKSSSLGSKLCVPSLWTPQCHRSPSTAPPSCSLTTRADREFP